MKREMILGVLVITLFAGAVIGQNPSASPTPSVVTDQMTLLQEQIELLKRQQEYEKAKSDLANQRLKEIMNAIPRNDSLKVPEGNTTFKPGDKPSAETSALSYAALKEVSARIGTAMQPTFSQYSAIVIYNESDFLSLAKYRFYRGQSDVALARYRDLVKRLEDYAGQNRAQSAGRLRGFQSKAWDPATTALSLPMIGSSLFRSIADLMSVFRTETIITESRDTVDDASLGTAMANELKKADPKLKIYFPEAFTPEYELEAEGSDSILMRIADVNAAYLDVADFLSRVNDFDEKERKSSPLKEIIDFAEKVADQLGSIAIRREKVGSRPQSAADEDDSARTTASDLRQLIRAEKLDRFMRQGAPTFGSQSGPRVGILRLRSLASGGSRRETRNLFLGNKIRYSGSVTIEVLLFDVDGLVRASEIFSLHTGFRKMNK